MSNCVKGILPTNKVHMMECIICLEECADLFHPTKCACAYYAHAQCHVRTRTVANIGCVYCRWSSVDVSHGNDHGFYDHYIDDIVSFDDRYFLFVGRIVGGVILWSVAFATGAAVGYMVMQ
jgi:hypothetical protein